MKKCIKCRKTIPDHTRFCPYCGWLQIPIWILVLVLLMLVGSSVLLLYIGISIGRGPGGSDGTDVAEATTQLSDGTPPQPTDRPATQPPQPTQRPTITVPPT